MNSELQTIERDDPTALKVFIAEYYFLKKDMEKAYELFAELFKDPTLSPVMKETVRGYLVTAGRELRKAEIKDINFKITAEYDFNGQKTIAVITRDSLSTEPKRVGDLVELLDFNLKRLQQQEQSGE